MPNFLFSIWYAVVAVLVGAFLGFAWFAANCFANAMWRLNSKKERTKIYGYLYYGVMQLGIIFIAVLAPGAALVFSYNHYDPLFIFSGVLITFVVGIRLKWIRPMAGTLKEFLEKSP